MNIVMMDTGRESARETALWFLKRDCEVTVVSRRALDWPGARCLAVNLLNEEALAYAAREMEEVDILVLGAENIAPDGEIGSGHDSRLMLDAVLYNVKGALNLIEACLPRMENGLKRIACVSVPEASNSWSRESDNLSWHQSLAGMNMLGKLLFNRLRPKGFTFRWYCEGAPGSMRAGEYILSSLCYDEKEPYIHSDENRLTFRDGLLREISW